MHSPEIKWKVIELKKQGVKTKLLVNEDFKVRIEKYLIY